MLPNNTYLNGTIRIFTPRIFRSKIQIQSLNAFFKKDGRFRNKGLGARHFSLYNSNDCAIHVNDFEGGSQLPFEV